MGGRRRKHRRASAGCGVARRGLPSTERECFRTLDDKTGEDEGGNSLESLSRSSISCTAPYMTECGCGGVFRIFEPIAAEEDATVSSYIDNYRIIKKKNG